jgi:hypothetical protein
MCSSTRVPASPASQPRSNARETPCFFQTQRMGKIQNSSKNTHLTVLGTHPMYNILSCKKLKVLLHQSFYITIYWLSKAEDLHTHANYHYEAPSRKAI